LRASAAPAPRRSYALAAIAVVALIVRLIYLQQLEGSPLLGVLMGDSRVYDAWAQRIAAGEWLGSDVFYQTPLYPYTLGVIFGVAGHDPGVVRIVQACLGAVACLLLGLTGRRLFGARAGLIAAGLLAVYPPAIFFDGLIQKASLDVVLITLILFLLTQVVERRRAITVAVTGVVTGALILNRENAFVLVPVIAGWLLLSFRDNTARARTIRAAVFLAGVLAVLLPVGLRNYHVGGAFVLSTSQLGPNFYIGNNPHASGSYESLLPGRGDPIYEREDATALASKAAGRSLSPSEVSDYWLHEAVAFIRSHPGDWLALTGKKLLLTINAAEIPDTESIGVYAEWSPLLRAILWLDFGIVFPVAVFGVWAHRREWPRLTVFHAVGASLLIATAAFFVVARYRHPVVPIVLLFAGAGVDALARVRLAARGWIPGAICAVLAAAVAHLPIAVVHDQTFINLGSSMLDTGRPAEAVPLLRKAVGVDPEDPGAQSQLGLALVQSGQPEAAIAPLREAVRLQPASASMHSNLALALMDAGDANVSEALAHFAEAVRLQPDDFNVRMNFGGALCRVGRIDEGIAQYREAGRRAPDSVDAPFFAARAYAGEGRLPDALASLEEALAIAKRTGQTARTAELSETIGHTRAAIGRR
jgi:Flp pilus assembly protein TadD/4-amino-4-deoxy-L-arabinose transferase-like glycosyltransferase